MEAVSRESSLGITVTEVSDHRTDWVYIQKLLVQVYCACIQRPNFQKSCDWLQSYNFYLYLSD